MLLTSSGFSSFLNTVISFFCVGLSLYFLAQFYQLFSSEPIIKHTTKCKYCKKRVSEAVSPSSHLILP